MMNKKHFGKFKRSSTRTKLSNGINLTLLRVREKRVTLALEMARVKEEKAKKIAEKEAKYLNAGYAGVGDRFADDFIESVARVLGGVYGELAETKISFRNLAPFLPNRKTYLTKSVAMMVLFSVFAGLTGIGSTAGYALAYFNDVEESKDNIFIAGKIDFWLGSTDFHASTTAISLFPNETILKRVKIDEKDSNPFKYSASTTIKGDKDFCEVLNVEAKLNNVLVYDGPLVDMLTDATTTLRRWDFEVGMGNNNFQNGMCHFDIDFIGSQTRHGYELGEAYNDTETIENWVSSWGFRINKVYYDVAPDRGLEGDNEWVEIYNQTDTPLDINGWELCDNTSCDILSASELIPAMGYGFITASSTTASSTHPSTWYIPDGVVEVNIPDSKIGNGLGNDNDMLLLKRPDGVIIDQMNWGDDPDPLWGNYNDYVWSPGAIDVLEGNALARVPSGFDTDSPSDFTEIAPPIIDLIYPDEGGSYTWYWTYSYNILWEALNGNGDDSALDMSIFYVKDINHNDELDEGDEMLTITESTENDGEYEWTVPSGFLGYIWIYLVATGPENLMWNSGTLSGDIYDPMPIFIGQEGVDPETVDMEAPVINIQGNNPAYLELGATYADLGAMVTDNVDTNLGVNTSGDIDTNTLGEYEVVYTSVDSAGNIGTATRSVVVYDPAVGIPVEEEASEEDTEETLVQENGTTTPEIIVEDESGEPTENTGGGSGGGSSSSGQTEDPIDLTNTEEDSSTTTPDVIEDPDLSDGQDESATSTPQIIVEDEDENATTTPEIILEEEDENATSTPGILNEEENATTTPEVITDESDPNPLDGQSENGTTTPAVIVEDENATTTPETLDNSSTENETENATSTPELIVEEEAVIEEDQLEEESSEESTDPGEDDGSETSDVVEEEAVIEDPVVIEEETEVETTS